MVCVSVCTHIPALLPRERTILQKKIMARQPFHINFQPREGQGWAGEVAQPLKARVTTR